MLFLYLIRFFNQIIFHASTHWGCLHEFQLVHRCLFGFLFIIFLSSDFVTEQLMLFMVFIPLNSKSSDLGYTIRVTKYYLYLFTFKLLSVFYYVSICLLILSLGSFYISWLVLYFQGPILCMDSMEGVESQLTPWLKRNEFGQAVFKFPTSPPSTNEFIWLEGLSRDLGDPNLLERIPSGPQVIRIFYTLLGLGLPREVCYLIIEYLPGYQPSYNLSIYCDLLFTPDNPEGGLTMETVSLNFITLPSRYDYHSFLHFVHTELSNFSSFLNSVGEVNRELVANVAHPAPETPLSFDHRLDHPFILNQQLHNRSPVIVLLLEPGYYIALRDQDDSILNFMGHATAVNLYKACWVYNRSIVTFISEVDSGPGFLTRVEDFMSYLGLFGYNSPQTHITQRAVAYIGELG